MRGTSSLGRHACIHAYAAVSCAICSEDRNGLKESLLRRGYAADETRAEAGAPAAAEESSWYSLFGTALVFVWPDTLTDQVSLRRNPQSCRGASVGFCIGASAGEA